MKKLFYVSLALLTTLILFIFGAKLLFTPNDVVSDAQFILAGFILLIGGICAVSLRDLNRGWLGGVATLALSFYLFARASGSIEYPWLAHVMRGGGLGRCITRTLCRIARGEGKTPPIAIIRT